MTQTATSQEAIKALLESFDIARREIKVYGSQIVITCACPDTASKWVALIAKFAKVRSIIQSWDEAKENKKTCLNPSMIKVWRIFARIS